MTIALYGSEINISGTYGLACGMTGLADGGFAASYSIFSGIYGYNVVVYDGLGNVVAASKTVGTPNGGTDAGNGDLAELSNQTIGVSFLQSGPAPSNPIDAAVALMSPDLATEQGPFNPGTNPYGFEYTARIAARPAGGFMVVWDDDNAVYGRPARNAIGQIFDNTGAAKSAAFVLSEPATSAGDQRKPDVAVLANGNYAVAWEDGSGADGSGSGIRGRVFRPDGTPVTSEIGLNAANGSDQSAPRLTALAGGGFAAVWESGGDLYTRVFDNRGNPLTLDEHVATYELGVQSAASICPLLDGGFLIAWTSDLNSAGDGSGTAIKARTFSANGDLSSLEILVNSTTTGNQRVPIAAALADGRVIVSYTDESQSSGADPVARAQIIDPRMAGIALDGTLGSDKYVGSRFADTIDGSAGDDAVSGGAGRDHLSGGNGRDALRGGAGADTISGGTGRDALTGNSGADRFVFAKLADSKPGPHRDVITDFSHAEHDRVNLAALDANSSKSGDQSFSFIGGHAFHAVAGELRFANHILQADVDGDGSADIQIYLPHVDTLVAGTGGDLVL